MRAGLDHERLGGPAELHFAPASEIPATPPAPRSSRIVTKTDEELVDAIEDEDTRATSTTRPRARGGAHSD